VIASSDNEPVAIPGAASEPIAELRRLVEAGRAKLVGPDGHQVELPAVVQQLLLTILKNLQADKTVSVVAEHQELATERAANILGVSRPFLIRLLEQGDIPFRMVGSHRHISIT